MAWPLALISAQLWLGEITRPRPKKGTFQNLLDANKGDETRPIPYIRGRWKTTPQRIWLGDFSARAVERDSMWTDYLWAGALAGLLDFITVSYRYYVGQGFALCWGPINRVHQIYVQDLACAVAPIFDNAGGTILLDFPTAFGGDQPPGQGGVYGVCDVLSGSYTQSRNPYLQSVEVNVPGLHGIAALIVRGRSGATESGYFSAGPAESMQLHEWQVELMAWPDVLGTGDARLPDDSYNRIHAMYEWATSADYGAQYPTGNIHLPSWRAAAATVASEGNGFSGEINTGGRVQDVFDQLKASVDAEVYEHPSDGLKIKLIRKDYSIPSLPLLTEATISSVEEYTPGDYADTFNRVILNFTNAENNYQPRPAIYEDPANWQIQRRAAPHVIDFPGVASATLAQKLVTQTGRSLGQPLPPLITNSGAIGESLWPGDCYRFRWTDPFIEKIFRVHARTPNVSYEGERNFRHTATEDQYSLGLSVFGTPSESDGENPADIWATAPPSATFDSALLPPSGLEFTLMTGLAGELQSTIHGAIVFGAYAGGQYARVYVTEPGGAQTLSPLRLSPDSNNKAQFTWPALVSGSFQFCIQTYSLTGATNGVKVCATIGAGSFSVSPSYSLSPSASVSPSVSPSSSVSPSGSASPSHSVSPSASTSPSGSASASTSPSVSPSASTSPSHSTSSSQSPSASESPSVSPSHSTSPSSSASPSAAGPIFENRGDQLTAGDTNPIDTWVDNIGTNDFLSSGSDRPTQQNNTLNSMATALFSSAQKMTLTSSPGATTNLSFLAVIKVQGGGVYSILGSDDGPQVRISGNKIGFLHGGVLDMGNNITTVTANIWWTIGVTYDGSIVRFYLNGAADGTNSVSHTFSNPVKYIAVRDSTAERLSGSIAHVVFYDQTLGSSDMTNGGGGKTDELRSLWAHY